MKNRAGIFALMITGIVLALLLAEILVRIFFIWLDGKKATFQEINLDCLQKLQPYLNPESTDS